MIRYLLAFFLLVACAGRAQAGSPLFDLKADETSGGSLPSGTPYEIQAVFKDKPEAGSDGFEFFRLSSINVESNINNLLISWNSPYATGSGVILVDPTNTIPGYAGDYTAEIAAAVGTSLLPEYSTAGPAFSAASPTPTEFSGYQNSSRGSSALLFYDNNDFHSNDHPSTRPTSASIRYVPGPGALTLLVLVGLSAAVLFWLRRRRHPVAAA